MNLTKDQTIIFINAKDLWTYVKQNNQTFSEWFESYFPENYTSYTKEGIPNDETLHYMSNYKVPYKKSLEIIHNSRTKDLVSIQLYHEITATINNL
jgi:hypothetical protein